MDKQSLSPIKKTIMVADDDPSILEAIALILEDAGYNVITTVNGETVFKMEDNYPDLLLLDIWMSGQDGGQICTFLKSRPHTKDIPIIMISANKDTAEIAKSVGADGFITKPFDMNNLLTIVKKYSNQKSV